MRSLKIFLAGFGRKAESELNDEMRFHLEKEVELNIARGMSADQARRQALIAFGGLQQTREAVRQTSWSHLLETLLQDLRYAWRILRKSPGFTAVAVLTLALGTGMNTAIFSLIDAVLFRSLPASHPEELVFVTWHAHHRPKMIGTRSYGYCRNSFEENSATACSFSLPFFNGARSLGVFSQQAAFARASQLNLSGNGAATIINNSQFVSGDFFAMTGVNAAIGRVLQPADDLPGAAPSIVLSYAYWQGAFGGAPDVVGRVVKLNGQPFTIVGVVSPGFLGLAPGDQSDLWLPLSASRLVNPNWTPKEEGTSLWWLAIIGRLKPGVSAQQAQAALGLLFDQQTVHGEKPYLTAADAPGIELSPAQQGLQGSRRHVLEPLYVMMLTVALVLLIACANIAGLLLARATGRSKEIALRLTLGARRGRLLSQLLVESLLLSAIGSAVGLILARWGARWLMAMADTDAGPSPYTPQLDLRVLAFTAAVAIFTGLIFGLVPALRSLRVDIGPALKIGATASSGAPRARWYSMGNALVVSQVSLAIVALVTAGLLVRTLRNLKNATLGFDSNNLLVFDLNPVLAGYKGTQVDALFRDLQEQFAAMPGVTSVTYSWASLLKGWEWDTGIHIPGTPENEHAESHYLPVGPKFFSAMGIPFKMGRDLTASDFAAAGTLAALPPGTKRDPKGPAVAAIVNEAFVRRYLPHQNPLGQHVDEGKPDDPNEPRGPGWDIIGVAGDARYDDLRGDIPPTMYVANAGNGSFAIRTAGDPLAMVPTIREMIYRKGSSLAMYRPATQKQLIDRQVSTESLVARLSSFFGFLALALACIGIYGLLSYEVTRRTREIGIRMAVGAQQGDVMRMVVRQGLLVAIVGTVIGAIASMGAKDLLSALLYNVKPGDPITLLTVGVILVLVALTACYLPARRATRVDPLVALRYE